MTDTSLPPLSSDETPIDAEFEPAEPSESAGGSHGNGPGWLAYGLLFLIALSGLLLAAAAAGYVPGFKPGTGPITAVQSELANVQSALDEDRTDTSALSTNIATLQSRADSLSADRTRTNADLRTLRSEIEALQADISTLQRAQVANIADQGGDTDAVTPGGDLSDLTARVASLEDALINQLGTYDATLETLKSRVSELESQASSEGLTAATATNARTEAALALSAIEAAARRGRPFLGAQQKLAAAMPSNDAIARLAPIAPKAVPPLSELRADFPALATEALNQSARSEGGNSGWMRAVFGDGIQVRQQGVDTDSDHLDRAATALDAGDLSETIEHIRAADTAVQSVFTDWLNNAEDRLTLEQTLEALRLTMIAEER
ncbi:MAG: hypothetical protein AAGL99_03745 [Pseudomonadota bacterium]